MIKQVLVSFVHAFSMYSKIPMPRASWKKEDMKYAMCFFPLVGAIIGVLMYGSFQLFVFIPCKDILKAVILTLIPMLITGGIHLDGLLDTMDARNSYKDRQAKLEILKDPHVGAFAVIKYIIYVLLLFGFTSEISKRTIGIVSIGFILSRALSGLSVVYLKGAKTDGLLATFSSSAHKKVVRMVLILYVILSGFIMMQMNVIIGASSFIMSIIVFFYYRSVSYKEFGGITGDLAGYFLQICELILLITTIVVNYLVF